MNPPDFKPAMVVAHPGHELRIHHWVETNRPEVCVLTDGSGRTARSRLASTTRILQRAGASSGPIYGRYTDADFYRILHLGDGATLSALADRLTDWLIAGHFTDVAGDAVEGYNTTHDICRYLIACAATMVRLKTGRELRLWSFLLDGSPDDCPAELRDQAVWLKLDEPALQRKLAAAEGYPELAAEVESVKRRFGLAPFALECLQPTTAAAAFAQEPSGKPYYEEYGERQVAAGHYSQVIRYREHIMPLRDYLRRHAETAA